MVISFFLQCAVIVNLYPWWYNLVMTAASKRAEWLIPINYVCCTRTFFTTVFPAMWSCMVDSKSFQLMLQFLFLHVELRESVSSHEEPTWGCGSTKQVMIYVIFIFFFCPSFMQHNTIEDILGRGEKLDDLVDKSEGLTLQSKAFYKTVSEIKEGGRGLKENCLAQLCGCEIHIHIVWCIFFIIGNGVFEIFRLASGRFFGLLMWSFASF